MLVQICSAGSKRHILSDCKQIAFNTCLFPEWIDLQSEFAHHNKWISVTAPSPLSRLPLTITGQWLFSLLEAASSW